MSSISDALDWSIGAIEQGDFAEAIEILERISEGYEISGESKCGFREYVIAQEKLIKAYTYAGEKEKAVKIAEKLAGYKNPQIREWAKKVLSSLSPQTLPTENISFNVESHSSSVNKEIQSNESRNNQLWDEVSAYQILYSFDSCLAYGGDSSLVKALENACEGIEQNTKEYFYEPIPLMLEI